MQLEQIYILQQMTEDSDVGIKWNLFQKIKTWCQVMVNATIWNYKKGLQELYRKCANVGKKLTKAIRDTWCSIGDLLFAQLGH